MGKCKTSDLSLVSRHFSSWVLSIQFRSWPIVDLAAGGGPPTSKSTANAETAQDSIEGQAPGAPTQQRLPGLMGLYPDPADLRVSSPPPPPPLPESDASSTMPLPKGEKSRVKEKFDQATDVRRLAARSVVPTLRQQLEQIVESAGTRSRNWRRQWAIGWSWSTARQRTGTGKSTVVLWEAMVWLSWLEDYCSRRGRKVGRVICSQQRRKVTISLAEEVRRRHAIQLPNRPIQCP